MFQLMIIEDELWMRRGLEQMLDWNQLNIHSVLSVKNGKEALEVMQNYSPDIIITDIKMPKVNGFSMIDILSQETDKLPKIIIVSGYNDFDFAKKAIKTGVVDYILKPIEPNELKQAIIKASDLIVREKKLSQVTLNLELKNIIYEKMFFYTNSPSSETILPNFYFFLILTTTSIETMGNLPDVEINFISLPIGVYQLNIIASLKENELCSYIESYCKKQPDEIIGISSIKSNIEDNFLSAYKEAELDFQKKYYPQNERSETYELNIILSQVDEEIISKALYGQNKRNIKNVINSILEKYNNFEHKCIIQFQIFIFLSRYLNSKQLNSRNLTNIFYNYRLVKTIEELEEIYILIFEPLIEDIINNFKDPKVSYVSLMEEYIESNYSDSSLSLDRVAEYLNLSPAYLSYIIKKETKLNLTSHIKKKRIEAAKETLINSNLPVYEISIRVGYNDVKYFIRVFKKEVGITPNRYREVFR